MNSPERVDEHTPWRWRRRGMADLVIVLLLIIVGAFSSWRVLRELGDATDMRFSVIMLMLRPPVMYAAGHGMRDVDITAIPGLSDFYMGTAPRFDVDQIPEEYEGLSIESDSYAMMHYHLMFSLGTVWRILGVSRWAVNVLAAVFFVVLLPIVYGLFRLTAGPLIAGLFSLWLAFSPALLAIAPSIRDFSKAPFLLGGLLLLAWLTTRERRAFWLPLWGVVAGCVVGVGFGFRQDVALLLPLGLAAFLFLVPVAGARPWLARGAASVLFLLAFGTSGYMPLRGTLMDNGSATAQAFVQGVSQDVERRMDFGHASYTHHYDYSDIYDWTVVNAFARRNGDETPMGSQFNPGHGEAGQRLVRQYWLRFPGDMLTRALSALWQLPQTPGMVEQPDAILHIQPDADTAAAMASLLPLHAWFTPIAARFGWVLLLLALALTYTWQPRLALFLLLGMGFLGGYPSLLYEFRHFFHLSIMPYWAAATVLALGVWHAREFMRTPGHVACFARRVTTFSVVVLAASLVLVAAQACARAYQDARMLRLYDQYGDAKLAPVDYFLEERGDDVLLMPAFPLPNLAKATSLPPFETAGDYLMLEFDAIDAPLCVGTKYTEPDMVTPLTRIIEAPLGNLAPGAPARFFMPIYSIVWPCADLSKAGPGGGCTLNYFLGVVLKKKDMAHLTGVYTVRNGADFALWPYIVIPREKAQFFPHKLGPLDAGAKSDFRDGCIMSLW